MSQRCSGYKRQPNDHYTTPSWVARIVAEYLRGRCRHVWAPADTRSSPIAQEFRAHGFEVTATANNFFAHELPPCRGIDCIATNPPYGTGGKTAVAFIEHALELAPIVAMLARIDFDSGKTRVGIFRDCPIYAHKIVLIDRVEWFPRKGAAGPSENHAWYLWDRRHHGLPTHSYARKEPPCR
jgi:hypothetical protein